MVAGVCIECGKPVGSGKRACPHCGCAEPMPTKARHKCLSCGSGVMSVQQACSHCGAPDPLDPGPIVPPVVRCEKCGHPTHVAAGSCKRCRAPSTAIAVPGSAAPVPAATRHAQAASELARAAATTASPPAAGAGPRAPSAAFSRSPTADFAVRAHADVLAGRGHSALHSPTGGPLAAPLWDPVRTPIELRHSDPAAPPLGDGLADGFTPTLAPPEAEVRNRFPCGRCGELQARGTLNCARCGVASPETAEPLEVRRPFLGLVRVPTTPLVVTLLGLAALGAFSVYTRSVKDEGRVKRIWQAFGSHASESAVANVEREAELLDVSTDVLLRVRFHCLHHENMRPSTRELLEVRTAATRAGRDPGVAVADFARRACQQH